MRERATAVASAAAAATARAWALGGLRLRRAGLLRANRRAGAVGLGGLVAVLLLVGLARGNGGGSGSDGAGTAAHLSSSLGRRGGGTTALPAPAPAESLAADLAHIAALRHLLEAQRAAAMAGVADPWGAAGLGAAAAAVLESAGSPAARAHLAAVRAATTAAVSAAIHAAQHPRDCASARLLVGTINKACGFGCEMHHAAHLLALALATNRTLVLSFKDWRYDDAAPPAAPAAPPTTAGEGGGGGPAGAAAATAAEEEEAAAAAETAVLPAWETAFLPITPCPLPDGWGGAPELRPDAPGAGAAARVLKGGIIDAGAAPADPQGAMPPDVFALASTFTARPEVWWVGALQAYLMRAAPAAAARRAAFAAAHGLAPNWEPAGSGPPGSSRPYVAVHVRRTDKVAGSGAEAAAHGLEEYLGAAGAVTAVWAREAAAAAAAAAAARTAGAAGAAAPTTTSRRLAASKPGGGPGAAALSATVPPPPARPLIYLATDDAAVLAQARSAHPGFDFVGDDSAAASASLEARHSRASLAGIADDVERLAGGAWLVGTFSSQISRLAAELAAVRGWPGAPGVDPSFRASSVDSGWYYGGGADVPFTADVPLRPASWAGANPPAPGDDRVPGGVATGGRLACSPLAGHPAGPGVLNCQRAATPDNKWTSMVDAPAALIRRAAVGEDVFPRLLSPGVAAAAARGESGELMR